MQLTRNFVLIVALGWFLAAQDAEAKFYSGNSLVELCSSAKEVDRTRCEGYVTAIADVIYGQGHLGDLRSCPPATATVRQLTDTVKKWLENTPTRRQYNAASLVPEALAAAFPCK